MSAPLPTAANLARMNLAQQHPLTHGWVEETRRLDLLSEEHAFDLQLAGDLELAGERAGYFAPEQPPETFLNRWAQVAGDLAAMLSMRYEGGDREKPFVDAITSRSWDAGDLGALAASARTAYGALRPQYLRLWSPRPAGATPGTLPDRRILAAPLTELRSGQVPPELSLVPTRDLSRYDDARAAYEAVNVQHPAHRDQARLEPEGDLQESTLAGTLFDVLLGGQ